MVKTTVYLPLDLKLEMVKTTVYLPLDLKLRIEQVANARQCSRARGEIWHGEAQLQDLTPLPDPDQSPTDPLGLRRDFAWAVVLGTCAGLRA